MLLNKLKLIQLIDFKVYSFLTSYKRKVTLHLKTFSNLFFLTCLFFSTITLSGFITFIKSSITLSSHMFSLNRVNVYFNHFTVIFPFFFLLEKLLPKSHCQDELIAIFLGFACSKIWVLIFGWLFLWSLSSFSSAIFLCWIL